MFERYMNCGLSKYAFHNHISPDRKCIGRRLACKLIALLGARHDIFMDTGFVSIVVDSLIDQTIFAVALELHAMFSLHVCYRFDFFLRHASCFLVSHRCDNLTIKY